MEKELWHHCEVPYTRYEVSNLGRVRNAHTGKLLKPVLHVKGYFAVNLYYQGKAKIIEIQRLVATAFVPGWRKGLQVNHKNGIKTDNRAENLEWVTASENTRHGRDVLLKQVKPIALFDKKGRLQRLYHSSAACHREMGGCVRQHISKRAHFRGYLPLHISVPMYREIVHLVSVHRYTLHSAWIESLTPGPSPKGEGSSNSSNVGADSLPFREGLGVGSSNSDDYEQA